MTIPHTLVSASPGILDRGTIGIWFHQSKVLTSGELLTITWLEVAQNEGHDHVIPNEVVKFLIVLAEQKSNVFARAPAINKNFPPKNGVTPNLPSEVAQCL